jgi:hypothetical protein
MAKKSAIKKKEKKKNKYDEKLIIKGSFDDILKATIKRSSKKGNK